MPRKRKSTPCYPRQLLQAMGRFLPHRGLPLLDGGGDARVRWTDRLLVACAILMAWEASATLTDRFAAARATLAKMYPGRRRPGATHAGFAAALAGRSALLLAVVCAALRTAVNRLAKSAGCWDVEGWALFGCDGTKIDCPRTAANEAAFGCGGKAKTKKTTAKRKAKKAKKAKKARKARKAKATRKKASGPQQLLTALFHVGTGLPWAFARGAGTDGERSHLLAMLDLLPAAAMLLADAGFTGYELLQAISGSGRSFVIRVGGNVRLLTRLGYWAEEHDGIVCLWPERQKERSDPPMVLRLIRLTDGRNRTVCLLTNVLSPKRLSDAAALRMYRRRWGVEVLFRSLKQTLSRRKMLSDAPANAAAELDWSAAGLWLLGLMSVEQVCAAGHVATRWSPAQALRAVRRAMGDNGGNAAKAARRGRPPRRGMLARQLAASIKDPYERTGSKTARDYPHKKTDKPPGEPKARTATPREVQLAAEIRDRKAAA